MKKSKYLDIIMKNAQVEEEQSAQGSNVTEKLLKRIFIRISVFLTIKVALLISLAVIIFLPFFLILWLLIWLSWGDDLGDNSGNYYIDGEVFVWNFSSENLDTPLWIPVEKWIITYGYDYKKYNHSLITKFLKIIYSNAREYYRGHRGVDFWKTYQDKQNGYSPYILSTLRGIVKQVEKREENGSSLVYHKNVYAWWKTLSYQTNIKKWQEKKIKPYGNHIVVSNLDGDFYVLFAHLSSLNKNIFNIGKIGRWAILWKMGTSGNSTWIHLHYEIRYCWENKNHHKRWEDCSPVNPLWSIIGSENTFLWFSKLPPTNTFIAWDFNTLKENYEKEEELFIKISDEYEEYCKWIDILFIWKETSCKEIFPIIYSSKDNESFPKIKDELRAEEIWKDYLKEEYDIEKTPTIKQISEIKKIEGISKQIYTSKELNIVLWKKFSHGKFLNTNRQYKITLEKNIEDDMYDDFLEDIEEINKKSNSTEELYNTYYENKAYEKGKNPYVYNMDSKENIFMDILDSEWNFISKYSNYGALTIFKILK